MSDSTVPCAYTWASPTITNKRDIVTIQLGTEKNIRTYELHVEALRMRSGYFHKSLPASPNEQRSTVHLALSVSKPFDIFANWLYSGRLDTFTEFKCGYLHLCELYAFADSFGVPLLRNKIVDVFFNKLMRDAFSIPCDIMKYMEEKLRDSTLRNMMQDIMLNCGVKEEIAEWQVNLAKGFGVKSSAVGEQGGVVPFGRSSDVRGYLGELKGKVCERYHEHLEGDETVVRHEDGWFFDPPLR
ncbi:hypothetical protein ACET3X_006818 [Alternaria dauci]|uniref:BTB domain-containing protein n=1 Tax=Alternaria dauci TaxID=48095 RepID=A0ABR3UFL5_9PLEO